MAEARSPFTPDALGAAHALPVGVRHPGRPSTPTRTPDAAPSATPGGPGGGDGPGGPGWVRRHIRGLVVAAVPLIGAAAFHAGPKVFGGSSESPVSGPIATAPSTTPLPPEPPIPPTTEVEPVETIAFRILERTGGYTEKQIAAMLENPYSLSPTVKVAGIETRILSFIPNLQIDLEEVARKIALAKAVVANSSAFEFDGVRFNPSVARFNRHDVILMPTGKFEGLPLYPNNRGERTFGKGYTAAFSGMTTDANGMFTLGMAKGGRPEEVEYLFGYETFQRILEISHDRRREMYIASAQRAVEAALGIQSYPSPGETFEVSMGTFPYIPLELLSPAVSQAVASLARSLPTGPSFTLVG